MINFCSKTQILIIFTTEKKYQKNLKTKKMLKK